jgi:hypothetical protein
MLQPPTVELEELTLAQAAATAAKAEPHRMGAAVAAVAAVLVAIQDQVATGTV